MGGDVLDCYEDSSSPAASLLEEKLLIISIISDSRKGLRFMSIDIKYYFLRPFLQEPEYIRRQYNIDNLIANATMNV